jgi:outer membrane protein assembly factor BamD
MRNRHFLIGAVAFVLAGLVCAGSYAQKKPKIIKSKTPPAKKADATPSAEPDKVLYDRAMSDMKRSRYTEARLDLQTLINTYPDSEYLAKAKLGVADSFYKEGGTSNLTQSVDEYKNFIVFFPFLDEAAYAQMQVAMAHYKMTEKADRDNSQAQAAEDEFREFLLKYPQSPLVPQAEQNLRNVQEVLAEGEFRIAHFYYMKADYRASAARLVEVSARYPLYSQSDEALSMLGNIYMRAKQVSKNEDAKNHWSELAAQCYDRILQDYPLSRLAPVAKERLTSMGMPVPAADPQALARMQKQQEYEKEHHPNVVMKLPMGMIKSSPDVYSAAQSGTPNLNPPDDLVSATEVLNQDAPGPTFSVGIAAARVGSGGAAPAGQSVDTESVGTSDSAPTAAVGVTLVATPTTDAESNAVPSTLAPATSDPAASNVVNNSSPAPVDPAPVPAVTASTPTTPAPSQSGSTTPQAAQGTSSSAAKPAAQATAKPSDPKTESTSKKKKGLHKIIPF